MCVCKIKVSPVCLSLQSRIERIIAPSKFVEQIRCQDEQILQQEMNAARCNLIFEVGQKNPDTGNDTHEAEPEANNEPRFDPILVHAATIVGCTIEL